MMGYTERIRHWAADTRRAGRLFDADGTGEVGLESEQIGRRLAVRFTLRVENDRVSDARYQVFGCGYSMATCAVAADLAVGSPLHDIREIDAGRLDAVLDGLPDERRYCADLAVEALYAAADSALSRLTVTTSLPQRESHGPCISSDHSVYRLLMSSRQPDFVHDDDRHLFACLISVAAGEPYPTASALGLDEDTLESLLLLCFPGVHSADVAALSLPVSAASPECNEDLLSILLAQVPTGRGLNQLLVSCWLARILATRASLPGHLWVAMGLTERPQLTAAIRRHLPSLAAANRQNMRWKRFFFKQLCDLNGGTMCKAPNCGVCSDYAVCFAED